MRAFLSIALALSAACSTVQSRRDDPPIFQQASTRSLEDIEGCVAEQTARQDVNTLPKRLGATLTAAVNAGPSRFVTWVVDIDDLSARREVSVYATRANSKLVLPAVTSCL